MISPRCNILFPIDFSSHCVLAAPCVKRWVDRFGATLNTLHVIDANALGYPQGFNNDFLYNELPNLISKCTANLKYFSDQHFGENVAHYTVLGGCTAEEIECFSRRENIDLIMLPRNHQNLGARIFHDSLTAMLLERCGASVWTTEHVKSACASSVNSILCAVHFDGDAILDAQNYRILQTVQKLTSAFQAKVTFLQVIDGQEKDATKSSADLHIVARAEPWAEQARKLFGNSPAFLRRSGDVVKLISDTASSVEANLIVVGRTRPGTIGLGVQAHILKIDRVAGRPVLSIR
jgi:nucleotide-binding universal stress UspA family protein